MQLFDLNARIQQLTWSLIFLWKIFQKPIGLAVLKFPLARQQNHHRTTANFEHCCSRFKNLKKDIDLRIGCQFENLKKWLRSEVQMSVTWKSDMDLRIGCQFGAGVLHIHCVYLITHILSEYL
jgi:hypothetical protein